MNRLSSLTLAALLLAPLASLHAVEVTNLRCEYRENPLGLDVAKPRLSWVMAWDGKKAQGGMNSLNHYAFGFVGEYPFGMIGGIQPDSPGYKRIRIQPVIGDGLTWANARYDSNHGLIACHWRRENGKLSITATIPANTTATVCMPAKDPAGVTEFGAPATKSAGVKFLRMEDGEAVFEVGSGAYRFQAAVDQPAGR